MTVLPDPSVLFIIWKEIASSLLLIKKKQTKNLSLSPLQHTFCSAAFLHEHGSNTQGPSQKQGFYCDSHSTVT